MITPISEEVASLYEMFAGTPEGMRTAEILLKADKYFSLYVHKDIIAKFKKEILVQLLDPDYKPEDEFLSYTSLD